MPGALTGTFNSTTDCSPRAVKVAVTAFGSGLRINVIPSGGGSFDGRASIGVMLGVGVAGIRVKVAVGAAIVALGDAIVPVAATTVEVRDGSGRGVGLGCVEHAASAAAIAHKKIFFISFILLETPNE